MQIRPPTDTFITPIEDSRRWSAVALREDDIIISTPPKCGTTWMQGIVRSLLWPMGDAPSDRSRLSPWVDVRGTPVEEMAGALQSQTHRRFIKTHSPADAIPLSPSVRYITVYRSAPDALVSWGNHRAMMRPEIMRGLNLMAAADGLAPLPERFEGDYETLFEEWSNYSSPASHLAQWWPLRHRPNVLMVHYSDLYADLNKEMTRVARFLDLAVDDRLWGRMVDRCRLDAMRQESEDRGGMDAAFEGGSASFYYRGGNGRGPQLLSPDKLARCHRHCADLLSPEAAAWLETGSTGNLAMVEH